VSIGSGRTRVLLKLELQGGDLLVTVTGGRAHVGAVGVWFPGLDDKEAQVIEMPGHREGPLAGECAEILGRASGKTVVAVVGIHQDHATGDEIAAIVDNVRLGARKAAEYF